MPPGAHARNPLAAGASNSGRNTPVRQQSGTPTKRSGPSQILALPTSIEPMMLL
jgi:hypothetical protein